MNINKLLIISAATFALLPGIINASPCDGSKIDLTNNTRKSLNISIEPHSGSSVTPASFVMKTGETKTVSASSGSGSNGDAEGVITATYEDKSPGETKIRYDFYSPTAGWTGTAPNGCYVKSSGDNRTHVEKTSSWIKVTLSLSDIESRHAGKDSIKIIFAP